MRMYNCNTRLHKRNYKWPTIAQFTGQLQLQLYQQHVIYCDRIRNEYNYGGVQ